ncbi:uncharacterized protein LOC129583865 [Paramacrobiotus metropolitanus]|uniref:uncharacterized protein LOC129583865 n=1 Tax=Paramacrobiotus metropolitanus TaxID=2943436 RepID=UPI0024462616|nr:uncharacterized protein LOC129583865 [Paramacrobiotus metropolitanus]XP_055331842.1 uncharacterized protein LOC129583865 [Paramacrobiotus metropolitanus]XP_055331843.1 uncharacterized protein LOC129583865 [Paramacrobiotus metropolitanus]
MPDVRASIRETWRSFSPLEKRNIAIYILGITLYKFGLEAFNGSIIALATNRYDYDAIRTNTTAKTFERVGLLVGLNQALQCVGSILIAPLIQRFPTKTVLTAAVFVFGLFTAILLIVDAATGGYIKPADWEAKHKKGDYSYYGTYYTDGIIPIYCVTGIAYGMVELIRRVIPKDIVGGDVKKLIRMDSLVHICYEVSGTLGAFATALALIPALGNNMSFIITPLLYTAAAITWWFISDLGFQKKKLGKLEQQPSYIKAIVGGFYLFAASIWTGAKIIFTSRKFIWLFNGYAVALYGHRFLENALAPVIAKRYLGESAWSQVMVGGSNFGELCGAATVFILANYVKTPIPWLRIDSLTVLIVWYLPFWYPPAGDVRYAWMVAATFIPISFGWAAGDVSISAYIQGALTRLGKGSKSAVSPLGAVMAFLYSTYIIIYAIISPLLGTYLDQVYARTGGANGGDVHEAIIYVGGVHFTIIAVCVMSATFIPKGSFSLCPTILSDEDLEKEGPDEGDNSTELPAGIAAIS